MLTEHYAEGREAAFAYLDLSPGERRTRDRVCPYPRGDKRAIDWVNGWEDAILEADALIFGVPPACVGREVSQL
jgi:hypothetical protein